MSAVQVTYTFADGETLSIAVEADSSFADALDEARAVALRLYREALGATVETLTGEDDDDG